MEEQSVHGRIGDINSAEAAKTLTIPRKKRICLVGTARDDPALIVAAQQFKVSVLKSETGTEYIEDTTFNTYFVLKQFEGSVYDTLKKSAHRVLGPTALLQLAEKKESLPSIKKPRYTQAMVGTVVVLGGFRGFRNSRDEVEDLAEKIQSMGGKFQRDIDGKVTHLIVKHYCGEKYRAADIYDIPIVSVEWVRALWEAKDDVSSYANNEKLIATHKVKPLYGAKVCFYGFPEEEKKHMCDILKQQGGEVHEISNCTHVVVDESNIIGLPNLGDTEEVRNVCIVKTGWFWTSVQNEVAADENDHRFPPLETVSSPSSRRNSQQIVAQNITLPKHPCWLGSPLPNLLQNGVDSPASVNGSFLDCTASPEKQLLDEVEAVATESVRKNLSQRHQVFRELVETEENYVHILNTIIKVFKEPLEKLIENRKELLNTTEVKMIFGNFEPIHDVHKKLLKTLHDKDDHWTEDISIGKIFLDFGRDSVKAYKPYFNFYERTKQMLEECDQNKPRFHAFLKNCQTMPECGRQSLIELYIQPVQRLPRIRMLLERIHKHTDENNPDYDALKDSASCIDKSILSLNADKGKTERQFAMFDIFNEIDNCPADLISSQRSFIKKCDVMEVLTGRNDHLVLFLFNDTLEICKKRSKAINGLQSSKLSQGKPYKHITNLPLSTIQKVVDIRETTECHKVFTLLVRGEKLPLFEIIDEEVDKINYLETLCRQIADAVRIADANTLLIRCDSHQHEFGTDVASGTLKKTIKSLFHNFYLEYMDPYVFLFNSMCETTLHVPLPSVFAPG